MAGQQEFPEIVFRAPVRTTGTTSLLRPEIVFDWNIDIDSTTFSDNSTRPLYFQLFDQRTGTLVPTDYVDYSVALKRVTVTPSIDLDRDTLYTVLVKDKVPSTIGRKSKSVFRWEFQTAAGAIPSELVLLEPANWSVQESFPTFTWTAPATGLITYTFQIDDGVDFIAPVYATTTTATSFTPSTILTQGETYYWRVLATTTSATGSWSDVNSFYYGTIRSAHESSNETWYTSDSFGLSALGFNDGSSNLRDFPTISLTFTSTPDSNFSNYISIWYKSLGPRNDSVPTSYGEYLVTGSWSLAGSTITFTPSVAIGSNIRYEIRVQKTMTNTSGVMLGEDLLYYFTGYYAPYYCDVRDIRAKFLSAGRNIPDDLINFYIYKASLEANVRYYSFLLNLENVGIGDTLKENLVRDQITLNSFGVGRWVEAAATYFMLKAILFDLTPEVDSRRHLGDFEYTLGPGVLKALEMAMQTAKEEMDQWDNFLAPQSEMAATTKSYLWSPDQRDGDQSIPLESQRDDPFRRGGGWYDPIRGWQNI